MPYPAVTSPNPKPSSVSTGKDPSCLSSQTPPPTPASRQSAMYHPIPRNCRTVVRSPLFKATAPSGRLQKVIMILAFGSTGICCQFCRYFHPTMYKDRFSMISKVHGH